MQLFITTVLSGLAGASCMQMLRKEERTRGSFYNYFLATTALFGTYALCAHPAAKLVHSFFTSIACYQNLYANPNHSMYDALFNAPYAKILTIAILQLPCVFLPLPIAIVANIAISYGVEYLESEHKVISRVFGFLPDFTKVIDSKVNDFIDLVMLGNQQIVGQSVNNIFKASFNVDLYTREGNEKYVKALVCVIPALTLLIFNHNGMISAVGSLENTLIDKGVLLCHRLGVNILLTTKKEHESYPHLLARTLFYTASDTLCSLGLGKSLLLNLAIIFLGIPTGRNIIDRFMMPKPDQQQEQQTANA